MVLNCHVQGADSREADPIFGNNPCIRNLYFTLKELRLSWVEDYRQYLYFQMKNLYVIIKHLFNINVSTAFPHLHGSFDKFQHLFQPLFSGIRSFQYRIHGWWYGPRFGSIYGWISLSLLVLFCEVGEIR